MTIQGRKYHYDGEVEEQWAPCGRRAENCPTTPDATAPQIGDSVRIMRDEYPELVGRVGTVTQIGPDGTTVWVETGPSRGAWCSRTNLSVITPQVSDHE